MIYRTRSLMLPLLIFVGLQSFAQIMPDSMKPITPNSAVIPVTKKKSKFYERFPRHYQILSLNGGFFSLGNPGYNVEANFPYTTLLNATGDRESLTFTGKTKNIFSNQIRSLGVLFESVFKETNDIAIGIGGFHSVGGDGGIYFHAGYRYVLNFGWVDVKPGIDFYFFSGSNHLGDIDNRQKNIYFKGHTAYEQFSISRTETITDDDGNTYDETVYDYYDADRLEVRYVRQATALQPLLVASTHWRRLSVSIEAGYMRQLSQNSSMVFQQWNDAAHRRSEVGRESMKRNGVLSGPKLGVMIGILL